LADDYHIVFSVEAPGGLERADGRVWPEMLDALRDAGWHNYSLFLREDGLLFGYFETPVDLATAQQAMAPYLSLRTMPGPIRC
jgi:L-rhamnose mutarotase